MKRILWVVLALTVSTMGAFAQETKSRSSNRRGEAAGFASRDASVLSVMGWGIGIAVGIATLFALLDNNSTSNHTHSSSSSSSH